MTDDWPSVAELAAEETELQFARFTNDDAWALGTALQLEQLISRAVGQWAHRTYRRSPMIIPVVVDA